jgi:hypothetical protein
MTISVFKDFINDAIIPFIEKNYKNFDGDIIDLEDQIKDELCYGWLKSMKSWYDDILPPVITDQDAFLDAIYAQPPTAAMTEYRNDIYAYLESTLAEILAEEWAEDTGEHAEPFQGYGWGG